ncbi:MAG TPA: NifU N-terminal domain-containing protein [Longimicrobiales bacterium]
MTDVDVRFQPTPNPNAGKFSTNRQVVDGDASRSYFTREQAQGDPLAEALMAIEGVSSLFMVDDFVTVTKLPEADWGHLIPLVEAAIRANL